MQISASASSHKHAQTNKGRSTFDPDILMPSNLLVHIYPVYIWLSSLLLSPPRVGSPLPGKAERGRGANWTTGVDYKDLGLSSACRFFWSNRCCIQHCQFNVDGDTSRFSWPSLALLGLQSSRRYMQFTHKLTPFECKLSPQPCVTSFCISSQQSNDVWQEKITSLVTKFIMSNILSSQWSEIQLFVNWCHSYSQITSYRATRHWQGGWRAPRRKWPKWSRRILRRRQPSQSPPTCGPASITMHTSASRHHTSLHSGSWRCRLSTTCPWKSGTHRPTFPLACSTTHSHGISLPKLRLCCTMAHRTWRMPARRTTGQTTAGQRTSCIWPSSAAWGSTKWRTLRYRSASELQVVSSVISLTVRWRRQNW